MDYARRNPGVFRDVTKVVDDMLRDSHSPVQYRVDYICRYIQGLSNEWDKSKTYIKFLEAGRRFLNWIGFGLPTERQLWDRGSMNSTRREFPKVFDFICNRSV